MKISIKNDLKVEKHKKLKIEKLEIKNFKREQKIKKKDKENYCAKKISVKIQGKFTS